MNRIDKFLHFLSFIYLSAFSSLLIQVKGLFGDNGILPSRLVVSNDQNLIIRYLFPESSTHCEDVHLLILLGIIISSGAFIFQRLQSKLVFFLLWLLYFSLYQIGQTFLWFQWDILLLETGFIGILLARTWIYGTIYDDSETHFTSLAFWSVKWLIFRLMFSSGVVKLLSECPTWWGLTALDWHYESQCIPTSLAWFAHQLPQWFQKLSVVSTYVIEIFIPILFFIPIETLQLFCFCSQLLFQVLIILSGNYNFFNLLTIALCLSLLPRQKSGKLAGMFLRTVTKIVEELIASALVIFVLYESILYFGVHINWKRNIIDSKIKFSTKEFRQFLHTFVSITIYAGIVSLCIEIIRLLSMTLFVNGFFKKIKHVIGVLVTSVFVTGLFLTSLVPYSQIDPLTSNRLPHSIKELYQSTNKFELVHSYGLFRRMTGVGGRPEIAIEGSDNVYGPWEEYEFLYKPGNISRPPPFIIPHQPRLDWQMWFAALGSYQENPWLLNLLYRLLTNETSVTQLLERNPFVKKPPNFIRVQKYLYSYTGFKENSKNWWKREFTHEYLPPISLNNEGFMNYINQHGISYIYQDPERDIIKWNVKRIMDYLDPSMGHYFVWIVIAVNVVTKLALQNLFNI